MDEPRRTAAAASRYLIPIGLGVLLIGWAWPVQDVAGSGRLTVYYSRLLGVRFEGQEYEARRVAGSIVSHLHWVVVAVAATRSLTERARTLLFGAAALFGLIEILLLASSLLQDGFFGIGTVVSGIGGVVLITGAMVGIARGEIRETEEGRA